MPGSLYLIPNIISETDSSRMIPAYIPELIQDIRIFFVENIKSAQRLLKKICPMLDFAACSFVVLDEHTSAKELREHFAEAKDRKFGLISEAGCPCVADPGAELVSLAHQHGVEVIPLVGPSSILLALVASGLNGQNFAFVGYLPKERAARIKKIKALEQRSRSEGQTQIFMETPYRNQSLFEEILAHCRPETFLCVAGDITGSQQKIQTLPIEKWRQVKASLLKAPALFLLGALKGNT